MDVQRPIKLIALAALLWNMPTVATAYAKMGVVAKRIRGCDYYPVVTNGGITILEWYSGYDPDEDDRVVGEIESYGMKTVVFISGERESKVWVEDYWLSADRAVEKLREKCNIDD